ncbi:MAG: hypothetical protein AAGF26_12710 [Cyanobacteria bacterium P01_G01_bin.49]
MTKNLKQLQSVWHERLVTELPQQTKRQCHNIVCWLVDENYSRNSNKDLSVDELTKLTQRLEYRYRLLCKRYLTVSYSQGYRALISRLGSVVAQYCSVWRMKYCQKSQKEILSLVQQVLQILVDNDPYLQKQFEDITRSTSNRQLRDALVLTTVEEYCLHLVKNQPFFLHCLCQHLSHLESSRSLNKANDFSYLMEKITVFS